jgi:predicted MFS family arabinose efflux permease
MAVRLEPARPEQIATRIVFFIAGFAMSAWAPLVPFAKARLGVNEAMLGALLLCLGIGSVVAMPLAGALSAASGCRRVCIVAVLLAGVTLPVLAAASSLPVFAAALLLFGASLGALDVTMNIQAIIVERASGRPMMSGFHGMFSLGGIAGAAGVTALLGAGASPMAAGLAVSACAAAALAKAAPDLLPYGAAREGPAFALPHGIVLLIGVLCFVLFLSEGAVLDWSAVFLTSVRGVASSHAGLGYVIFALTMTAGRLSGDRVVQRVGGRNIIIFGGCCAACGFTLVALVPALPLAALGFALIGAGCSNVVPVLFTSVGRQTAMAENVAVPAITTLGYAGILLGPAVIGFVAQATDLPVAFLVVALMLLGVAALGRALRL